MLVGKCERGRGNPALLDKRTTKWDTVAAPPTDYGVMMNENARAWVEALESGKYKQTTKYLTRVNEDGSTEHCCLGVACELAVEAGVVEVGDDLLSPDAGPGPRVRHYDGERRILPASVSDWLGLATREGRLVEDRDLDGGPRDHLTQRNDLGESFAEIAEAIRTSTVLFGPPDPADPANKILPG